MPEPITKSKNSSLNDDGRTFFLAINDDTPVNSRVFTLIPYAEFACKVSIMRSKIASGSCKFTPSINGTAITTEDSDGSGKITVNNASLQTSTPNGAAGNYTLAIGQNLTVLITDISSPASLVIQITLRKTEVDN